MASETTEHTAWLSFIEREKEEVKRKWLCAFEAWRWMWGSRSGATSGRGGEMTEERSAHFTIAEFMLETPVPARPTETYVEYTDITVGPKITFTREGMTIDVDAQTTVPHRTFLTWDYLDEKRGRPRYVKFWNKKWPWRKSDNVHLCP